MTVRRWQLAVATAGGLIPLLATAPAAGSAPASPTAAAPWARGAVAESTNEATRYRFWAYFHRLGTTWVYADSGPGGFVPADGAVEGWRHEVAADGAVARPRAAVSFAAICADVAGRPGAKRVAIVLDFGTTGDAPPGQPPPANRAACALGRPDASTQELTGTVASLRFGRGGLVCAIDGFPAAGCADPVTDPVTGPATAVSAIPTITDASTAAAGGTPTGQPTRPRTAPATPAPLTDASTTDPSLALTGADRPPAGPSPGTWLGIATVALLLLTTAGLVLARRAHPDDDAPRP